MKRRQVALIILSVLLLAALPAFPPAVRAKAPTTFHGVLRYSENGPGAGTDGLATSLLVGFVGGAVAIARLQSMAGVFGKLSKNPSMKEVNNYLSGSVPLDLAGLLPVSAYYSANIDFVLETNEKDVFVLKQGTVKWNVANSADISGNGTSITDRFSGSGSYTLDPEKDVIKLSIDSSTAKLMYAFEVSIEHPVPTSGQSTWSAADGAMVFYLRAQDGVQTMSGHVLDQDIPEEVTQKKASDRGVYYTHRGPLSELKFTETYRNLIDAQVFVDYQIFDECSIHITKPAEGEDLTLVTYAGHSLDGDLEAETVPDVWAKFVLWKLPQFGGVDANYVPENAIGAKVNFAYQGTAPADNSAYGPFEISASLKGANDQCSDPTIRDVRVFFPRGKYNNPTVEEPNWFYYWIQTAAGQGHKGSVIYDKATTYYGYFLGFSDSTKANQIYVGDIFKAGNPSANPLTGKITEGIDLFAATVRHEWTHLENYYDWWGAAGYQDPNPNDTDMDLVPDDREADYGTRPGNPDSLGFGQRDCEVPAYRQEDTWPNGTANKEDWAKPGKQAGS